MRVKSPNGYFIEGPEPRVHPRDDGSVREVWNRYQKKVLDDLTLRPIKHYFPDYSGSIIPAHQ